MLVVATAATGCQRSTTGFAITSESAAATTAAPTIVEDSFTLPPQWQVKYDQDSNAYAAVDLAACATRTSDAVGKRCANYTVHLGHQPPGRPTQRRRQTGQFDLHRGDLGRLALALHEQDPRHRDDSRAVQILASRRRERGIVPHCRVLRCVRGRKQMIRSSPSRISSVISW
ncbi:hypothetical protein [Actinocrispum wychmicini]|uniref:hypothetical protein n=1 Tax=Actinocrispum wychmicini TaxID=1213861 RepID=UPI00105242D4|nr:hypothetical protein [Actinocrispum wychmicini]